MDSQPIIQTKDLSKNFGAVQAVNRVSISLYHNEILGLVGDNAAGKSTFLKVIAGVYRPDGGKILFNGVETQMNNPLDARKMGIELIYQDFMLANNLDVVSNVFLGREITDRFGRMSVRKMREKCEEVVTKIGLDRGLVNHRVDGLSGGQQQIVAIARALIYNPKVILMDEPTASLSVRAINSFLELVRQLRSQGISIIYVSHRIPDVLSIADRIIVLRRGIFFAERKTDEININDVIDLIMGEDHGIGMVKTEN